MLRKRRFFYRNIIKRTKRYDRTAELPKKKHWCRAIYMLSDFGYLQVFTDDTEFFIKPLKRAWLEPGQGLEVFDERDFTQQFRNVRVFYSERGIEGIFIFRDRLWKSDVLYCFSEMHNKLRAQGLTHIAFGMDNVII
jgi:hypothetical protein